MTKPFLSSSSPIWLRYELLLILLLSWAALASIPLRLNGLGISWDTINHHIYLGWIADKPRFAFDFLAASYQSYQFPYLYWPIYKLSNLGFSGPWAGFVLAVLQLPVVPAIWIIVKTGIPGNLVVDAILRGLGVALGLISTVILAQFDATSNDLLAAIPLVWSIALALCATNPAASSWITPRQATIWSGALSGIAVACKLSNGPLAILLPLLWFFSASNFKIKVTNIVLSGIAAIAGFVAVYGYWGWQLWENFGNPFFPFYHSLFAPLRAWTGWVS